MLRQNKHLKMELAVAKTNVGQKTVSTAEIRALKTENISIKRQNYSVITRFKVMLEMLASLQNEL